MSDTTDSKRRLRRAMDANQAVIEALTAQNEEFAQQYLDLDPEAKRAVDYAVGCLEGRNSMSPEDLPPLNNQPAQLPSLTITVTVRPAESNDVKHTAHEVWEALSVSMGTGVMVKGQHYEIVESEIEASDDDLI